MEYEQIFKKVCAGLSIADQARLGSIRATEKVTEVLNHKPPAGLSLVDLAQLGLESAKEKVEKLEDLISN